MPKIELINFIISIENYLREAEGKALTSLAAYKWERFGYWAAQSILLHFRDFAKLAQQKLLESTLTARHRGGNTGLILPFSFFRPAGSRARNPGKKVVSGQWSAKEDKCTFVANANPRDYIGMTTG